MKNFKTLYLFICLFFCGTFIFAQTTKFNVTFSSGVSNSAINNSVFTSPAFKNNFGWTNSVTVQYNFEKIINLKTGIAYESKIVYDVLLTRCEDFCVPQEQKYTQQLNYLTIPLTIEAVFGKRLKYFFNVGTYFSKLITSKPINTFNNPYFIADDAREYKNYDFGLSVGFGIKIQVGKNLSIPIVISQSQSLVSNPRHAGYTFQPDLGPESLNTRNITVGLSYSFGNRK